MMADIAAETCRS